MHILCVGLNHNTAPVDMRERFALNESMYSLSSQREMHGLTGLVVLSTCNRVEIYATAKTPDPAPLEKLLAEFGDVNVASISSHIYRYADESTVWHLMRVAAGLDSLVLGEPQILGQIARALQTAQDEGSVDLLLKRLFQRAIHAGKRVRSETGIACNPTSIAGVAVKLASENIPRLSSMQVTVLGAGETASLVVGALRHRGVENLQVLNRTLRHAQELTELWGGHARSLESLPVALQSSDLVISSIEAYQPIIQTDAVAEAMQFRPRRRLTLIDIGVPRNVESGTAKIPNVSLHNMDTLQMVLSHSMNLRKQERPHVENILAEEVDEFREYLQTYQVLPLITDLYEHAESIRKSELEKSLRRMKNLSEAEQANVEAMTRAIVKKILHAPTVNLRAASKTSRVSEYAAFIHDLFGLK